MRVSIFLLAAAFLPGFSRADSAPAGCEARAEVRETLHEKLNPQDLDKLKFADRAAREYAVLAALIEKYPQEMQPRNLLIDFVRSSESDQLAALQDDYRKQAAAHPDDPVILYSAARALENRDTPESIRLLESALAKDQNFAMAKLELAHIYSAGKRVDKPKSAEYLKTFFAICPASTTRTAQWLLGKSPDKDLQSSVAAALRKQLDNAKDRDALLTFDILWGLEFRTRPVQDHPAERQRVAADLKRLESLNIKPDNDWFNLLRSGYKQCGASQDTITAFEDRVLRELATSQTAYGILYDRFKKAHPEPKDQKDGPAWAAYTPVYREALKTWIRNFPDVTWLSRNTWFFEIYDDENLTEKDGLAALDRYLKGAEYSRTDFNTYFAAAQFLIEHKWQPKRALEFLHKAEPLMGEEWWAVKDDNLSQEDAEGHAKSELYYRQQLDGFILLAARLANRPAEEQSIRASIEGALPTNPRYVSGYWNNRARLAVLDNRKADALAYYQLALQTRVSPPGPWHGRTIDDLNAESRALWKELGGTDTAFVAWSKPPAARAEELKEGRWEKPTKTVPAFELADLSGKTWKLTTLEGKSVLINLWATWCGPCNQELPHLEELYKKVKDRADFQILTFNVDEELGLVEPFMKEKGYTFPVLPAYSLINGLFDNGWGIPQNWIIDPHGKWRSTQLGYGSEVDWEGAMIQRLEEVRKPEAASTPAGGGDN